MAERRQRNPRLYSRYVAIAKVVLPLIALAMLATLFLFTKDKTLEATLRFSEADLSDLKSGLQVSSPRFSGSNAIGDSFLFSAEHLAPDSPDPSMLFVESLSGEIRFLKGSRVLLNAGKAELDLVNRVLDLSDGISVVISDGFRATTDSLIAHLSEGELVTGGAVEALSPMGKIEAGLMRLETLDPENQENRMIWFENGVKLVFYLDEAPVTEDEGE